MLRSAVERQLEIVGEAIRNALSMDPELESRIPEARRIIATRNRIVHEYDVLDDTLLWDATQSKIPALATVLDRLIAEAASRSRASGTGRLIEIATSG